jgi:3-dehydroquinate synthase
MLTLDLDLGEKSYPIYIGENLLNQVDILTQHIKGKQVMIVSNTTVAPLYLEKVKKLLTDFDVKECILPDGEKYKTIETVNVIWTKLLEQKFDRSCTLVALGGGVVGDMTGFAASSYQRGVNFIQIPTTLLSQVDSSVGGKTGVNHSLGKNMIGAFYQPQCVLIDIDTLRTLPKREFSAGVAEVIKYGLLSDKDFHNYLIQNIDDIMNFDNEVIKKIIFTSCENKAQIVERDEFEGGVRALLNLGHTFGHAIENTLGYGVMLHGEAVAVGMVMAAHLSHLEGYIDSSEVEEVEHLLEKANLPTTITGKISTQDFKSAMSVDKKALAGDIRVILLKNIGEAFITSEYSSQHIHMVIDKFCTQ